MSEIVDAAGVPMNPMNEPESGISENPEAEVTETLPKEIDPTNLAELHHILDEFKEEHTQETASGSAIPIPSLDDLEVEPELRYLYERGTVEETSEGTKWVVAKHEFLIETGSYSGEHGKTNKAGYLTRLDDIITKVVNGEHGIMSVKTHGWRLSAIIPNGTGMGVAVFERNVKMILPDPKPVEKKTEVAQVKDEELVRVNEESQAWAAGQTADEVAQATDETMPT